ncbi:hypothetical protein RFI_15777, partial [Reticulomyxa filosa]
MDKKRVPRKPMPQKPLPRKPMPNKPLPELKNPRFQRDRSKTVTTTKQEKEQAYGKEQATKEPAASDSSPTRNVQYREVKTKKTMERTVKDQVVVKDNPAATVPTVLNEEKEKSEPLQMRRAPGNAARPHSKTIASPTNPNVMHVKKGAKETIKEVAEVEDIDEPITNSSYHKPRVNPTKK